MLINRRAVDLTVWVDFAGAFNIAQPPGSSVTPALVFGAPTFETGIIGLPATKVIPWYAGFGLSSLANGTDLLTTFNEWQMREMTITFQALIGDSSSSGAQPLPIPEVLSVANPAPQAVPNWDAETVLAFPNTRRSVLTLERSHTVRARPRPSIIGPGSIGNIATSAGSFWYTQDTTFFGVFGVLRNYPVPVGSTNSPFPVRVSVACLIAVRRPR